MPAAQPVSADGALTGEVIPDSELTVVGHADVDRGDNDDDAGAHARSTAWTADSVAADSR